MHAESDQHTKNPNSDSEMERIALVDGKSVKGIWAVFNMIGGVAGLLSLLTVAVLGGELKRQVTVDSKRLDMIESSGSTAAQINAKSLSAEMDIRREADISSGKRIEEVRADFSQRVSNITTLLEKLIDQQTQLITLIKVQQQLKTQ